jgi:hypothetical protein
MPGAPARNDGGRAGAGGAALTGGGVAVIDDADGAPAGAAARERACPPYARRYEALGRVMAALAGHAELLQACRELAWWRGDDHCWHIEWREGPHACEVAEILVGGETELNGLAVPVGPVTGRTASLDVMGVGFVLRAIDPLGMERLRSRPGVWRMAAALNGAVPAGGRSRTGRHWEALRGG